MKTFGTIAYDSALAMWNVKCESHVMVRLKRMFPRVSPHAYKVQIGNTPEVCRDLEWFLFRFPMVLDDAAQTALASGAKRQRENEDLVQSLLNGVREPRAFDLAILPRDYQKVAAEMCLLSGGLLLADDVGLGKTCVGICVIAEPAARPALVVTLTHLPRQWEDEIKRFAPNLTTHILKKGQPYNLVSGKARRNGQLAIPGEFPDVIIANYHKLAGWASTLAPIVKSIVLDEAQEVRHEGTAKYAAVQHIAEKCNYRLGLTATPIYNYGDEMLNVINCLRPGALGSRSEFHQEWCNQVDNRGRARVKEPRAFGTYLRDAGLMLRRTREDVKRELPALTKVPHFIEHDVKRLESIDSAATDLARIILKQGESARGEKFRAAEELSHLVRQATGIAKAPYVADFVRLLVESGETVVLYGWHREVYSLWMDRLKDLDPVMYTGSESPKQKQLAVERFKPWNSRILMISLRAGAGLDGLQKHTRTVVFGELDWSPGVHEQCIGRVYRDGQADPVTAYFLLADSGSDPVIADTLGIKTAQAQGIRDPHSTLVEKLQTDPAHIKRLAEAYLAKGS